MPLTQQELNEIKEYIINYLSDEFYHTKSVAEKMVEDSSFLKLLQDNPDYVLHYNFEDWAQYIEDKVKIIN